MALEECVLSAQSPALRAPTLQRAVPHAVPQPTAQEVTVQAPPGKFLLPLPGRDKLWSPLPEVMALSESVPGPQSQSCSRTIHVLPGQELPFAHPASPGALQGPSSS